MISCLNKPAERKIVVEVYPDGRPKKEQVIREGKNISYVYKEIFYYPDGKIKLIAHYDDSGRRHSSWIYYHPNGKVWSQGTFHHGKKHGTFKTYYTNGKIYMIKSFRYDQPSGTWIFYDSTGKEIKREEF